MAQSPSGEAMNASTHPPVKFSVCAVIDLQGFSNHLEISGYDLRTAIGEEALARLRNLEDAIAVIQLEQSRLRQYYPEKLHFQRINDAIVMALDLDDVLLPPVGRTAFRGVMGDIVPGVFSTEELADAETFHTVTYEARIQKALVPLQLFLGLVSRTHLFVQKREANGFHPGAKTVVTTGFRKPFISVARGDDILSANFAFANASVADRSLSGPQFYIENHIIELLAKNAYAKNILRLAHFHLREAAYDCLDDEDRADSSSRAAVEVPAPLEVSLFRRPYVFRRLNASPLSYLHQLPEISPYLSGGAVPNRSNPFYAHVADVVKHGMTKQMIEDRTPPQSFMYNATNDLDTDVGIFYEYLSTGNSVTKEAKRKAAQLATLGLTDLDPDSALARKLEEFAERTVTIEIPSLLKLDELGDILWAMSEDMFSGLLPILDGDLSRLEFPPKK